MAPERWGGAQRATTTRLVPLLKSALLTKRAPHETLRIFFSPRCHARPWRGALRTDHRAFLSPTSSLASPPAADAAVPVASASAAVSAPASASSPPVSPAATSASLPHESAADDTFRAPLTVPPQDPWDDLRGLVVTAKLSNPRDVFENRPIAIGRLVDRISGHIYRVKFEAPQKTWHSLASPPAPPAAVSSSSPTASENVASPPSSSSSSPQASAVANAKPPLASVQPRPTTTTTTTETGASEGSTAASQPRRDEARTFDSALPLTLGIGTRVALVYDDGAATPGQDALTAQSMNMEGLIVRVNGNNTYTVLMDNGEVELSVDPSRLLLLPPGKTTCLVFSHMLLEMQTWLRSCVVDARDCEAAALILFKRGWRLQRLFLLERGDLAGLTFIPHLQREAVIEKAQWERDYYQVLRNQRGERIKDRDYRYAISKYKGTISCIIGVLVVSYVFVSNMRAYDRQQRSYQLRVAAEAIAAGGLNTRDHSGGVGAAGEEGHDSTAQVVARPEEEDKMARVFRQLDAAHPRIVVVTGFAGNGKSALCRRVMEQEGLPAVFVHVRGGSEDTLRSIVRSLGVLNVEVCGDLMGFLSEAIREARTIRTANNVLSRQRRTPAQDHAQSSASSSSSSPASPSASSSSDTAPPPPLASGWANEDGHVPLMVTAPAALGSTETAGSQVLPIIYIKLMDSGRLEKAYREAVGLVVDHQVCHLVFEVPMESLTVQARRLSRLDFYTVPNFSRSQAFKYLLNVMEPTDMAYFVEVVGTNCNDLDELYAAVRQRGVNAVTYTAQKLMKGMRRLHAAASLFAHGDDKISAQDVLVALQKLASVPFDQGRPTKQVPEIMRLGNHPFFKDILLYDPLRDRWFFCQQVLHTAARCFYCPPASPTTV